jgi:hypothetical protein
MKISYVPDDESDRKANAHDKVDKAVLTHANHVLSFAKCALILSNLSSSPRNEVALVRCCELFPWGSSTIAVFEELRTSTFNSKPSGKF